MVDHVTGKCKFADLGIITLENGIPTILYGPWLRAKNYGSFLFINPMEPKEKWEVKLVRKALKVNGSKIHYSQESIFTIKD